MKKNFSYAVIVVTHHPDISLLKNIIDTVKDQELIIIDNNSRNIEEIKKLALPRIVNDRNLGLAHAQNQAIGIAAQEKFDALIFFDQDSKICKSMIDNLITDFESLQSVKIAAIGPTLKSKSNDGYLYPHILISRKGLLHKKALSPQLDPVKVSIIISSGMLIKMSAMMDIGTMDEDLFIDFVDTEWCLRALSKGYSIYQSKNSTLLHDIGEDCITIANIKIPIHSPERRYYRIRNPLILIKKSHIPKLLVIREIITFIIHQSIIVTTQKNRTKYLYHGVRGLADGIIYAAKRRNKTL